MGQSEIMIIIFGIFLLAFGIYYIIDKNKKSKSTSKTNTNNLQSTNTYKSIERNVQLKDMSQFIKFDKIANDMIYQKNGEKYTMVIECKGINYELMSEIEQMAVEEGFITFLNTLKFPIQLYVQTRSIDLANNIKQYKKRVEEFEQRRQDIVSRYNKLEDDIDATPEEVQELKSEKLKYTNISEYVGDITKYVERMALNKYMLQRKHYVILSYYKSEIVTTEKFTKEEYEDMCYRELYTRAQGIIGSLLACSVQGKILTSNELAQLIYISLNRDDEKAMDIKNALESGFYRLYTTSDDLREKKQAAIDAEIKQESLRRIEEAIREGIENGTIVPEEEFNEELDKKIDKTAIKMVDSSDMQQQTKEEIKNIILDKRKEKLKVRSERKKKLQEDFEMKNVNSEETVEATNKSEEGTTNSDEKIV